MSTTPGNKQVNLFSFFGKSASVTPTNDGDNSSAADIVKPAADAAATHTGSAEKKVQFSDLPEKSSAVPAVSSEKTESAETVNKDADACNESMDRLASQSDASKEDAVSQEELVKATKEAGKGKKAPAKRKRGEGKAATATKKMAPAKSAKKDGKTKEAEEAKEAVPEAKMNTISDAIKAMPVSETTTTDATTSDADGEANGRVVDMAEASTGSTGTPAKEGISAEEEEAAFADMDEEMDKEGETDASAVVTPAPSAKKIKRPATSSKKSKAKTPAAPVELSQQAKDNVALYTAKISEMVNQLEVYSDAHPQLFEEYGTMGAVEHIQTLATAEYHACRRASKAQQATRAEKAKKDKEQKEKEKAEKEQKEKESKEGETDSATEAGMEVEATASDETAATPATPSDAVDTPSVTPTPACEAPTSGASGEGSERDDMEIVIMKAVDTLVARTVQGKKDPLEEALFFVGQTLQKSYDDLSCLPALDESKSLPAVELTSRKVGVDDVIVANRYRECLLIALRHLLAIDSNGESTAMDMEGGEDASNSNIQEALMRIAEREVMGQKPAKGLDVLADVSNVSAMYRWNVRRESIGTYFEKGVAANVRDARAIISRYGSAIKSLVKTIEQCNKHPYDEAKVAKCVEVFDKAVSEVGNAEKRLIEQEEKRKALALEKAKKDAVLEAKKVEQEAKRQEAEAKKKEKEALLQKKKDEVAAAKAEKEKEKAEKLKEKEVEKAKKEMAKLEQQRLKDEVAQQKVKKLQKQQASFGSFFGAAAGSSSTEKKASPANEQGSAEVVDLTDTTPEAALGSSSSSSSSSSTLSTSPTNATKPTPKKAPGVVRATSSPHTSEALSAVMDRKIIKQGSDATPEEYTDSLIAKIDSETSFQKLQSHTAAGTSLEGNDKTARRHTTIEVAKAAVSNGFGEEAYTEFETKEIDPYTKTLSFYHDRRPAYCGTFSKKSVLVTGRTPFNKDLKYKDYEYDSEEEWESDAEGEDIDNSDGEEEEDGNELEYDDMFRHDNDFGSDADSDGEEMAAGVMKLSRDQQTYGVRFISKKIDAVPQMVTDSPEGGRKVVRCSNVDRDYVSLKNYTTLFFAQPGSVPYMGQKDSEAELMKERSKSSSKKGSKGEKDTKKDGDKSSAEETKEPKEPKVVVPKHMDEALVPELIRHVYGKKDGVEKLVNEFIAVHDTQIFNNVRRKIKEVAKKEKGAEGNGQPRWVVPAETIEKYNLTLGTVTEDQPDLTFDLTPITFSPLKPKKEKRVRVEKPKEEREFTSKRLKGDSTGLLKPLGHEWWPTPPSSPEREEDEADECKEQSAGTAASATSSGNDGKQASLVESWNTSSTSDASGGGDNTSGQEMEVETATTASAVVVEESTSSTASAAPPTVDATATADDAPISEAVESAAFSEAA